MGRGNTIMRTLQLVRIEIPSVAKERPFVRQRSAARQRSVAEQHHSVGNYRLLDSESLREGEVHMKGGGEGPSIHQAFPVAFLLQPRFLSRSRLNPLF